MTFDNLPRYRAVNGQLIDAQPDGEWVRFSDLEAALSTEQPEDTPKPFLDAKALETLANFRRTIDIQREKGRPELADAMARLLPTIEGLFMRVQMYEERFGVMNPLQPIKQASDDTERIVVIRRPVGDQDLLSRFAAEVACAIEDEYGFRVTICVVPE